MKITELIEVNQIPSHQGTAWSVTFKTEDGRLFELKEVMQENKPELHHIQQQAEQHSEWFWNFGAKEISHTA